jgi:hypothetical protein
MTRGSNTGRNEEIGQGCNPQNIIGGFFFSLCLNSTIILKILLPYA